jgi:hypothetical protein
MNLIFENYAVLSVDISEALAIIDREIADITDFIFMLKEKKSDLDEDALIVKTLGSGVVLWQDIFYVSIVPGDYLNITPNKAYVMAIGIKYDTLSNYLELLIKENNKITITQDAIRA